MFYILKDLRVIWTCMIKDMRSSWTQPIGVVIGVFLPVNFLILFSLFVLSGSQAPTAVVMYDTGPYAQKFYSAMAHARSFRLQTASAQDAQNMIQAGQIVAIVTIPANFETRLRQKQPVQLNVEVNNLNVDFTNDIRRGIRLSVTIFYGNAFPDQVTVTMSEHDLYAHDTDYLPYLAVSILVIALMVGALLQSGIPAAGEWELGTIKELLLSPASRWSIAVGKMLGSFVMALLSIALVLAILIFAVGIWPVHWGEVIGFTLLCEAIFIALGILLGTLLKQRQAFVALAFGSSIPLFFISGAFGPLTFLKSVIFDTLARIFPMSYAIVVMQHAFHGFDLNTYGLGFNVAILCGYVLVLVALAALVLRRSTVAS